MSDFGNIIVHRNTDPAVGESFTAEWQGGDMIRISSFLMDDHLDPPFHVDGENLTICQFKLRLVGRTERGDYIAERVNA